MSEEVTYSAGDQLTFHGLVNDLNKLRSTQEHLKQQLMGMARVYPSLARNTHFQQIQAKTTMALVNYDDVIREYEQKNQKAEQAAKYNTEMDKRNRIVKKNIDKPWLPLVDGE